MAKWCEDDWDDGSDVFDITVLLSSTPEGRSTLECVTGQRVKAIDLLDNFLRVLLPLAFGTLYPSNEQKQVLAMAIVRQFPHFGGEDMDHSYLYNVNTNKGLIEDILRAQRR